MQSIILNNRSLIYLVMAFIMLVSCVDEVDEGTRPVAEIALAQFSEDSLTVTFSSAVTDASYIQWDFGDKSTSTEANPTHTYAKGGVYNVVFNARSRGGSNV